MAVTVLILAALLVVVLVVVFVLVAVVEFVPIVAMVLTDVGAVEHSLGTVSYPHCLAYWCHVVGRQSDGISPVVVVVVQGVVEQRLP